VASPPLPTGTRKPHYSQRPLRPLLAGLAVVLAAVLACAGLWLLRGRFTLRRARTA
jgi:hypothetical protein